MRILHLISSNGLFGAERVVIELSNSLRLISNCYPTVGVIKNLKNPHTEIAEEAKSNDLPTIIFPCKGKFDVKTIFEIRNFLRRHKIDIIHCHGYKSNFYGLLASKNTLPTLTTNHNWLTTHWKLKIYCFLDGMWIRHFDRIVAVSEEIKREMAKYNVPEEKIVVIDNGIDVGRFNREIPIENIRRGFGLDKNIKVVGTIGSLKFEKGHIFLLRAAKEVLNFNKEIKFLIIGDGALRKDLENEAKNLRIERNVIFAGHRNDIPEMLSIMDIFVLPSVKEGLPMVILEAMASKKPVIAARVGGIPKVINNEEDGILVEPEDVMALKHSILDLMNSDNKMLRLAYEGYEKVKRIFSSDAMCRKYYDLYRELMIRSDFENS
jgi:glycosyltransferase involved in cell wall biosynthesis